MREIKFRVWLNGDYFVNAKMIGWEDALQEFDIFDIFQSPDKMTPLQYTSLHDKNGREIYEGDIVRNPYKYAQPHMSEVFIEGGNTYLSGENLATGGDMLLCDYADQCEVIGNTFENPELLEASK